LPSYFYPFVQAFSLGVFFFSNRRKEKNTKKKTIEKKKMQKREGAYFQAPVLPSHFWLLLLPFCFKCFFLASSYSQIEEKKEKFKEKEKLNHKEEKNAKKGRSLTSSVASAFGMKRSSCFLLSTFLQH